nr:alpha amylase C-terminal domain-containing protein [Nocardioides ungokensis]
MLYLDYSREPVSGRPTCTAPGEPRGRAVPPGDERHRLQAGPRRDHDRGGVHVLGGRHPTHVRRWARLRLQVEHGLDARLARLHAARAGAPLLPPRRDDLLARLRLVGELRPPDQPRRGRARQGLAAAQDAGRPVAAAGQPARLPRLHVGPPRQAAALHGRRDGPGVGVGRGPRARLVAPRPPRAPGCPVAGARPEQGVRRDPAAWTRDNDPGTFQWIDANDAGHNVFSFIRRGSTGPDLVCVANFAAIPHEGYRLGLPETGAWDEVLNTDADSYTGSGVGNMGSVTAVEGDWSGQPAHADIVVPPLATVWFRRRD